MDINILFIAPIVGIIAILFGLMKSSYVGKQDPGNDRMKEISGYIHEGAMAFYNGNTRRWSSSSSYWPPF